MTLISKRSFRKNRTPLLLACKWKRDKLALGTNNYMIFLDTQEDFCMILLDLLFHTYRLKWQKMALYLLEKDIEMNDEKLLMKAIDSGIEYDAEVNFPEHPIRFKFGFYKDFLSYENKERVLTVFSLYNLYFTWRMLPNELILHILELLFA